MDTGILDRLLSISASDGFWYPCPLRVSSQQISVHSHSLCIAMNSFFRMAMGSKPNCFSSSMVSAKNACMCMQFTHESPVAIHMGWWISCRRNPDKALPLACQACRIRLQRCDLDRMRSQDLCQTPDGAIRPGSSLPSLNAQMIKRLNPPKRWIMGREVWASRTVYGYIIS